MGRRQWEGNGTYDVGMVEAPEDLHTLSSFTLTFFFGRAFSATSRVMPAAWAE
jgi:hypothetical protein